MQGGNSFCLDAHEAPEVMRITAARRPLWHSYEWGDARTSNSQPFVFSIGVVARLFRCVLTAITCPGESSGEWDEQRGKSVPDIFRAGDKAPTTGIYRVFHGGQHVEGHYVVALQGDIFPACLECSDNVRFDVALLAAHVNAHPLFKQSLA